jgi:predicted 2-oxoglutarate/Fe(II)-dependent dioxygenase YbiX
MTIQVNGLFPGELLPNKTLGGCIDIFNNVWPNPLETIASIENECSEPDSGFYWVHAETIGKGINQDVRTNYNLGITYIARNIGNQVAQNIHNQFYVLLLATTIPYAKKHNIAELHHEDYQLLKYKTGQEYKAHADGGTDIGRAISAVLYLNDDYEGGEIEFPNFGVKLKPKSGTLVLFPSTYPYAHIAHPVIEGTKYAIVTWIKDRKI